MAGLEVCERLDALEEADDAKDARIAALEERIGELERTLRENRITGLSEETQAEGQWKPRQDRGWRNHGEKL